MQSYKNIPLVHLMGFRPKTLDKWIDILEFPELTLQYTQQLLTVAYWNFSSMALR